MMGKITKILVSVLIVVLSITYIPVTIRADSGLESNYSSGGSAGDAGLSTASSLFSVFAELIKVQPGDEDYKAYQIVIAIICIIVFYVITNIEIFKVRRNKIKDAKSKAVVFSINLIPTAIFGGICLATELPLILYVFLLIIYIVALKITTKCIIKKRLNVQIEHIKELDKDFDVEQFKTRAFEIYKDIQLAWMNFELDRVKSCISEEIFQDYQTKLDSLKSEKQQNVMEKIEFKSSKLLDLKIEDNAEIIECEMKVTCYDYIIDNEGKVVKGKKDKKCNYEYELTFNKSLSDKDFVLVKKKLVKQK